MKWLLCMACMCGLLAGCVGAQLDEQNRGEEQASDGVETLAHGMRDAQGVWHVDVGRLFEIEAGDFEGSSTVSQEHVIGVFQRETREGPTLLRGVVDESGLHEIKLATGSMYIEAHERDFEPGPRELTFGALGHGEKLDFSGHSVHRVLVSRTDVVHTSADNQRNTFQVQAIGEGIARLLVATSTDIKLVTVSVLPENEVPSHARTVVELELGESWQGVSTMGVKQVEVGITSKLGVETVESKGRQVFVFKALRPGVTPVVFHSDVGESRTVWFSIVDGEQSTTIHAVSPSIRQISQHSELKLEREEVSNARKELEVSYINPVSAQNDRTLEYDAQFTLMYGETMRFDIGSVERIVMEQGMLTHTMCESRQCVTVSGAKAGISSLRFITPMGSQKVLRLEVLDADELPATAKDVHELRVGEQLKLKAGVKSYTGRSNAEGVTSVTQIAERGELDVRAMKPGVTTIVIEQANGQRDVTWIRVTE